MPITMLTAKQLAWMRTQAAQTLPGTCVIESVSRTPDGAGGWSEVWSPLNGGTVACRLDPAGGAIELAAAAEALAVEYRLTVPHDAPIAPGSRVQIGGAVYEVQRLMLDHDWRVVRRALVRRLA